MSAQQMEALITATVDRLKQIAGEAMDHLYLSDGPPQPDHRLLDICGDLLHFMKQKNVARERRRNAKAYTSEHDAARAECDTLDGKISSLLHFARKERATTAAGVYAKALVMRASDSGAPQLALSLANDLIDTPALRDSIWGNEGAQS